MPLVGLGIGAVSSSEDEWIEMIIIGLFSLTSVKSRCPCGDEWIEIMRTKPSNAA